MLTNRYWNTATSNGVFSSRLTLKYGPFLGKVTMGNRVNGRLKTS